MAILTQSAVATATGSGEHSQGTGRKSSTGSTGNGASPQTDLEIDVRFATDGSYDFRQKLLTSLSLSFFVCKMRETIAVHKIDNKIKGDTVYKVPTTLPHTCI